MTAMATGSAGVAAAGVLVVDEEVDVTDGAGESSAAGSASTAAASNASVVKARGGGAR